MIYGIGTDITEVRRFEKWVNNPEMLKRFFSGDELKFSGALNSLCQHYAVRFAAKEAFSKALGTGISGFDLKDVSISNDKDGNPYYVFGDKVKELIVQRCGTDKYNVHVSLSHEKEYATAFAILEIFS